MRNEFLCELDHWIVAMLHERTAEHPDDNDGANIGAAELARFISDYVLIRVAENPNSCWTVCDLNGISDAELINALTFTDELLVAAFIGAVWELNVWQGDEGVALMIREGVPPEDATAVAAAIEVVTSNLGARGQALLQRAVPQALPTVA